MFKLRLLKSAHALSFAVEQYLQSATASPTTSRAKRRDLELFISTIEDHQNSTTVSLHDITRAELENFVTQCIARQEAPATITRRLATIKHFLHSIEENQVPRVHARFTNPARHFRGPVLEPEQPKWLEHEEVERALSVRVGKGEFARSRNHLALCLMYYAGLRSEEARTLTVSQLSSDGSHIERLRRKGGRYATLPIAAKLKEIILDYLPLRFRYLVDNSAPPPFDRYPLLSCVYGAKTLDPRTWQVSAKGLFTTCKQAGKLAGIDDLHPHRLRHSFARRLVLEGTRLEIVQQLMGHVTLEMTTRYLTPGEEEKRTALNNL
jgi:integrase/recombinase XerD